jgi:hypothetical protein
MSNREKAVQLLNKVPESRLVYIISILQNEIALSDKNDFDEQSDYTEKAYRLALKNTKYNSDGKAVIEKDDEWRNETEWDDMFNQMKAERGV